MAATIFETASFAAIRLRVGTILRDKRCAPVREVYFQPGDDEAVLHDEIEALGEIDGQAKRDRVFDMLASNYLD
jgi:hypothetical protein